MYRLRAEKTHFIYVIGLFTQAICLRQVQSRSMQFSTKLYSLKPTEPAWTVNLQSVENELIKIPCCYALSRLTHKPRNDTDTTQILKYPRP
jgi:hypothetical protein